MHGQDSPTSEMRFTVEGMHCGGCANAVSRQLTRLDAVETVDVTLDDNLVRVVGAGLVEAELRAAITEAGYDSRLLA